MPDKTMNVYVVTPDGTGLTAEARDYVQEVICGACPELSDADFQFHSGTDLNDAAALAEALDADPEGSIAVVAEPDKSDVAFCRHGAGEDGTTFVTGILRDAAARTPVRSSWDALWESIEEGRREENGGAE